jgi:hypothetical protein
METTEASSLPTLVLRSCSLSARDLITLPDRVVRAAGIPVDVTDSACVPCCSSSSSVSVKSSSEWLSVARARVDRKLETAIVAAAGLRLSLSFTALVMDDVLIPEDARVVMLLYQDEGGLFVAAEAGECGVLLLRE